MIHVKRVYDAREPGDGTRYLVERLWPRGMKKEALHLDGWAKEAAPSAELRRWFDHDPEKWEEFRHRYSAELAGKPGAIQPIREAARRGSVTLLYSARDTEHNNAVALKEYLDLRLEEEQMPLEHSRPEREARFAAEDLHVLTLETIARALRQEPEYQKNGRNGTTLVKTPRLRQVLVVLRAGACLEEHTAPGPITVLVLEGELRFEAGAEAVQLEPGRLLSLPSERPHRVEALRDSEFLLTIGMKEPHSGVVFGDNFHKKE